MEQAVVYRAMALRTYASGHDDQDFWAPVAAWTVGATLDAIRGSLDFTGAVRMATDVRRWQIEATGAVTQQRDDALDTMLNWLGEN